MDRMRLNSITYFILSIAIRWLYNLAALFRVDMSVTERAIIHLLLSLASLLFGWFALQLFRKANTSGSGLGCFYLVLLLLNLVGGAGALFFSLVKFFSDEGSSTEKLWLF
ncbi:MAG TPA: hypothetical protein VI731_08845 [Bacteroidia bacterium]|nr:hypothetical protein [Bacteroidia bacterium]